VIVGVSPDSVRKHVNFKRRFKLPFTLVADVDHAVAEAYGVWVEKRLFGHRYMAVERTTFLIGPDGKIRKVWESPNVLVHAAEVQRALERLKRPRPAEG
jgi:peroxiredoxin Q/BCP